MSITRAGAIGILTLAIPAAAAAGIGGHAYAAAAHATCSLAGYSHANSVCVIVPASGKFSVKIPHTSSRITGTGSSSTKGTQITITKIAPPISTLGGFGVKVRATGKFKALHITHGKLWKYNTSKNRDTAVKVIASTGVYQVTT
jgi:hypothetical protein